jgi:5-bromo-4-chloroindolyl phosphate hydrolysis protein
MGHTITPIKNPHGTSADALQDYYLNALNGIRIAIERFHSIELNPRDYATFEFFLEAHRQHINQYTKLEQVKQHLETIIESI